MPDFKTPFAEYHEVQAQVAQEDPAVAAQTAAEVHAARLEEWGQFVAAERIYSASGALAFLPGHAVPASSVSDNGPVFPGQVARRPSAEQEAAASPSAPERPAGNAKAAVWREYAVANGVPQDDADDMTRAQLIERFPEPTAERAPADSSTTAGQVTPVEPDAAPES